MEMETVSLWTIAWYVGRVMFCAIFIVSGLGHLTHLQAMTGYAASKKVPAPAFFVVITGVMILVGGTLILLDWRPVWGCGLAVAFLIPVALIMHDFWNATDPMQRAAERAQFMKNISMAGGAILYAVMINRVSMVM